MIDETANTKIWTENDPELVFACPTHGDAEPVMKLLVLHGFQPTVTVATPAFNPNYAFSKLPDHVRLWVYHEEYDEAMQVLQDEQLFEKQSEEAGLDQMFGPCTDEELMDVIACESRHPQSHVATAWRLLSQRGVSVDPLFLDQCHQNCLKKTRKSGHLSFWGAVVWLMMGIANPPTALLLAVVALFWQGTDLNGQSYPLYSVPAKIFAGIIGSLTALIYLMLMALFLGISESIPDILLLGAVMTF